MDINTIVKNTINVFKAEAIHDFFMALLNEISQTYLGDKHILPNKKDHFDYCFNEVRSNFLRMGVDLKIGIEGYNWIYDFFDVSFYSVKKDRSLINTILQTFDRIDIYNRKCNTKYIEVYNLFK